MNIVAWSPKVSGTFLPTINVTEDKKGYTIKAKLPGMARKDVKITVNNNILTIAAEKSQRIEEKKKNSYYRESRHAAFSRSMSLYDPVDKAGMKSKFEHGFLTVILPKKNGGHEGAAHETITS